MTERAAIQARTNTAAMTSLTDAFTDSETADLKILVLFSAFGLMVSAAMVSLFSNTELLSYALLYAG